MVDAVLNELCLGAFVVPPPPPALARSSEVVTVPPVVVAESAISADDESVLWPPSSYPVTCDRAPSHPQGQSRAVGDEPPHQPLSSAAQDVPDDLLSVDLSFGDFAPAPHVLPAPAVPEGSLATAVPAAPQQHVSPQATPSPPHMPAAASYQPSPFRVPLPIAPRQRPSPTDTHVSSPHSAAVVPQPLLASTVQPPLAARLASVRHSILDDLEEEDVQPVAALKDLTRHTPPHTLAAVVSAAVSPASSPSPFPVRRLAQQRRAVLDGSADAEDPSPVLAPRRQIELSPSESPVPAAVVGI